jgi:hypothetical protein
MSEPAAEVIARQTFSQPRENLRLSSQAAKRSRMQNAGCVSRKWGTVGVRRLSMRTPSELAALVNGDSRRQSCS